jgi:hypothetical protein
MMTDSAKKDLEEQARLQRHLATLVGARPPEIDGGLRRLVEEAGRHQELIRAALGPLEDLGHSGSLSDAARRAEETVESMRRASEIVAQLQASFRLPEVGETARLLRDVESVSKSLERYREHGLAAQRAAEAMCSPWLDIKDRFRSLTGFVELQGIGNALRTMPPFDKDLAHSLRFDLGDWRTRIEWSAAIFTDPVARTAFYVAQGLDPALTAFPARAFHESLGHAGLAVPPLPLLETYTGESHREVDDEGAGFKRTNAAHDRLMRFETHLRKCIDEQMTAKFGDKWIKQRVPGPIREAWVKKREIAQANGEPLRPLIAYADFTDYVPIITRRDNWEAVFAHIFQRQTSVQESFQRLYPIRICAMHARVITQDDELYLLVETKRISSALGIKL